MKKIDTISMPEDSVPVYVSEEDLTDCFFSKDEGSIYFQISSGAFVSAISLFNIYKGNMFRFSNFVNFPRQFEDKGECVHCDCYTNVGFRLLLEDGLLCKMCLKVITENCFIWIRNNPSVTIPSLF